MRVLFVSNELIAADLARTLQSEGCEVKLFIGEKRRKKCFDNVVPKIGDWKKELEWVGKDGLIIFDDVHFGKEQDILREKGYQVVGGSAGGDQLEKDREFAQKLCADYGLQGTIKTINFSSIKSAIAYIKQHPNYWVVKQNGHFSAFNYVGEKADGSDVISILEGYQRQNLGKFFSISLQERVYGIEISVGRYFNGNDWVGPIEFSIEHKKFLDNDLGPLTPEMGTIMWYEADESKRLYQETLPCLQSFLREINFRGDVAINCLVNKNKFSLLELTTRFGSPEVHLQKEIHLTPWRKFLLAIARGEKVNLNYRKGYGLVVSLVVPPFPYVLNQSDLNKFYPQDVKILFREKLTKQEWKRVHFEEISLEKCGQDCHYIVAGGYGTIMHITGFGKTVAMAREQAYSLINKIAIPQMMYRTDIGEKFLESDRQLLKTWGWI